MRKFGLIGYPVGYSFSPGYFSRKFEKEGIVGNYESFPLEDVAEVTELLEGAYEGLNVTIPYKQAIIPFLDYLGPIAFETGAVNTIKKTEAGLIGHNTDAYGFVASLKEYTDYKKMTRSALILGTGGAARAVRYGLIAEGFDCYLVSRSRGDYLYYELDEELMAAVGLVVNTTPLGTYPDIDVCPDIPYDMISQKHLMYDLVYNPDKSLFLKQSEEAGAAIMNGLRMLELQAEQAWQLWNQETNVDELFPVKSKVFNGKF